MIVRARGDGVDVIDGGGMRWMLGGDLYSDFLNSLVSEDDFVCYENHSDVWFEVIIRPTGKNRNNWRELKIILSLILLKTGL